MATVIPTSESIHQNNDVVKITWSPLTTADPDGNPISQVEYADRCVTLTGTFGGATAKFQGSNDGTNWFDLSDPQTNAISKTTAGMEQVVETPHYVRPLITGGDGSTAITCTMTARRNK